MLPLTRRVTYILTPVTAMHTQCRCNSRMFARPFFSHLLYPCHHKVDAGHQVTNTVGQPCAHAGDCSGSADQCLYRSVCSRYVLVKQVSDAWKEWPVDLRVIRCFTNGVYTVSTYRAVNHLNHQTRSIKPNKARFKDMRDGWSAYMSRARVHDRRALARLASTEENKWAPMGCVFPFEELP